LSFVEILARVAPPVNVQIYTFRKDGGKVKGPPSACLGTSRIAGLICERLSLARSQLNARFAATGPGLPRNLVVDDLLPIELATAISDAFPEVSQMRRLDSFRERKYTSKSLEQFDRTLSDITFAFQHPTVLSLLADITGHSEISSDPQLYAGGLSTMVRGDFLHPHIDNSHDQNREKYRVLNALYYVSQNWSESDGGSLELWDERVRRRVEIPALSIDW
jgi:Rps23 Pro-64 3,4-dihydroxylase Tpa1-like proline 4-hydroxylase